ncbi:hypothetical protein M3231_01440 [Neobacillus mesonae]|nr:hypothetical protein [Neobacillus mesonae]
MLGNAGDVDENLELTAPRDPVEVSESPYETNIDYDSPAYLDMIARSRLNKGNNVRLKRAIKKVRQEGEPVVIAYIGGSITQGTGAAPIHLQSYAYRSSQILLSSNLQ